MWGMQADYSRLHPPHLLRFSLEPEEPEKSWVAIDGGGSAETKNACGLQAFFSRPHKVHPLLSGQWDSNPRHTPWEGVVLPLNYARLRNARILL